MKETAGIRIILYYLELKEKKRPEINEKKILT